MTPPGTTPGIPLERASTIPSAWYFDPDHHRRELERVSGSTWQQVALTAQVGRAGEYVTAEVAGEPVVVVRGRDGAVRAFSNVCRHRAGTVARDSGCVQAFSCSYHGWSYALDGALLAAPEMDRVEGFDRADFGLVPVRCEAWGPLVFVTLDAAAAPLADTVAVLAARAERTAFAAMEFAVRVPYTIECNWKVYVDNYLEGYHIPRAHPGLAKVLDYKRYYVRTEGNTVTQGGPDRLPPGVARAAGVDESRYLYVWMFPNFMLNVSPDYAQTNLIVPLGPERTLCLFDYFFRPGGDAEAEARRERSIAWSDEIQREDVWICESVQRNLHSRTYASGRYSAKRENGVYHFHELLRRALAG
jgi:choline monooxygenase